MRYPIQQKCSLCASQLVVQELKCDTCKTETSRLAALAQEQLKFVEIIRRSIHL